MAGVLIVGASRSGTSMTAGLFAAHGVWFGDCVGPAAANARGFFESLALKEVYAGVQRPADFAAWWQGQRLVEGWRGEAWGAKCGAERWAQWWRRVPDIAVIVQCYRDRPSIEGSRQAVGMGPGRRTIDENWRRMAEMRETAGVPCVPVETPRFIEGDFAAIRPAFEALGIEFSEDTAREWVDPSLWHHRPAS